MLPLCRARGIGVIPWSPMARGFLTRKPVHDPKQAGETARARSDNFAHGLYYRDNDFDVAQRVGQLSEKRGLPMAQIALAWVLHQSGVTAPIIGASKPGHLDDAVAALSVKLSPDELKFLEECYQPHPVLGL
jgi:aryl-alcohol dehydrogenase (NADP+)